MIWPWIVNTHNGKKDQRRFKLKTEAYKFIHDEQVIGSIYRWNGEKWELFENITANWHR